MAGNCVWDSATSICILLGIVEVFISLLVLVSSNFSRHPESQRGSTGQLVCMCIGHLVNTFDMKKAAGFFSKPSSCVLFGF
jgi:hypothetical protein